MARHLLSITDDRDLILYARIPIVSGEKQKIFLGNLVKTILLTVKIYPYFLTKSCKIHLSFLENKGIISKNKSPLTTMREYTEALEDTKNIKNISIDD